MRRGIGSPNNPKRLPCRDAVQGYAYTTGAITRTIAVSACDPGTDFDTKLYAYKGSFMPGSPIVCDDDTCSGGLGNPWVSEIVHVAAPNETYLYAVDAWSSSDVGNYGVIFDDEYILDPCVVSCSGGVSVNPGECVPGGDGDEGCNSPMQDEFFPINCGETVCGEFFTDSANERRDLDWYELTLTDTNDVTFLLASENLDGHGIVIIDVADVGGCNRPGTPQPVSYTATVGEGCVTTGVIVTGLAPGDYWVVAHLIGDDESLDCPNSQTYTVSIECNCAPYLRSDVDQSGAVNFDDLNLVLTDWGEQCSQ